MHTVNNELPIYDIKIRKYLKIEEGLSLRPSQFADCYDKINERYNNPNNSFRFLNWILRFDNNFPAYKLEISQ